MRKLFAILLICVVSLSGCSSDKNKTTDKNISEEQADIKQEVSAMPSTDATESPVDATESDSLDKELLSIKGDETLNNFSINENGRLHFPSGVVNDISFFLPGYKNVFLDKEEYRKDIEKIFDLLTQTELKTSETPYSQMDGAGLRIDYAHNNQVTQLELLSHYDKKTVFVRFSTEDNLLHDSEDILSEELSEIIHYLSEWKTFDTAALKEIDYMSIQVISGIQASDSIITLSGEQARNLLDRMISSAEVIDWNNGGYNILIKMFKGDVLTYNAYLSGDSSPTIGIETQFFKIDSDIVQEIYKELDYDMEVSN